MPGNKKKWDGTKTNGQWSGWQKEYPLGFYYRMSFDILFEDSVPNPSWDMGLRFDGQTLYNNWVKECKANEYKHIVYEGPAKPGGNSNYKIMLFNSMGGPRTVLVKNWKLEVFETKKDMEAFAHIE